MMLRRFSTAAGEMGYQAGTTSRRKKTTTPPSTASKTARMVKRRLYSNAVSLSFSPILLPTITEQALPNPMKSTKTNSSTVALILMAAMAFVPMRAYTAV